MGVNDKTFIVYGREIVYSEQQLNTIQLFYINEIATRSAANMYRRMIYPSYGNWENFSIKGIGDGFKLINSHIKVTYQKCVAEGQYDISYDTVKDYYYEQNNEWHELANDILEFNMGLAGEENAITAIAPDIVSAIDNARTASEIKTKQEDLYNSEEFQEYVFRTLYGMLLWAKDIPLFFRQDKYEAIEVDSEKIKALYYNLKNIPKEHIQDVLFQFLKSAPFMEWIYHWIIQNYGITKDVEDFAKGVGIPIDSIKLDVLEEYTEGLLEYCASGDLDPEQAINSCNDKRAFVHYYGDLTESEAKLQEIIKQREIKIQEEIKRKAIIEEIEKYKIGHYEELKRIWRDYLNEKGSSAYGTYEGKQIVSYINDEEKRLLSEKCKSLSLMSIDELEALRDELLDSPFITSNRAPYITSIEDTLESRYTEEYERWRQHIDSLSLQDMDGLEDQINSQKHSKEIITRIISYLNWRRDYLKKEKCLSDIENIRYGAYDDLKEFEENLINADLSENSKDEVKSRLTDYIQDEENRLLEEMCKSLSDMSIDELEALREEIQNSPFDIKITAVYINKIEEAIDIIYQEEYERLNRCISTSNSEEINHIEEQIKVSNYPDKIKGLLLQSIIERNDYLVKQELFDQIENIRYGAYDDLKEFEENLINVDLSEKSKDEVKIRLADYIQDEEKRLLEEMCSTLPDLSIEELKNVKSSINESDYDKENKAPYIEKVDAFLLKRYKEREFNWSGIIRSADLNQLDEIQEQIHEEVLPKDITTNLMALICNQRDTLTHELLMYTIEKLRYSPLDTLELFREEIIECDFKDDVLGDILKLTDNYILDSKRRFLEKKYGNISEMDINELKAAEKELIEADYEADIAEPYLKHIRDSIDRHYIKYLDSLTADFYNYDQGKLEELSAEIQQVDCKDDIKIKYTSIISKKIHSQRIDTIKAGVDHVDQLSLAELNGLIALIDKEETDESIRQDYMAKIKPWLHWAQKSFMEEQLSALSVMNRMEIERANNLLTAAEIPDFIMECGNKRIKERLLVLDAERINTLVPDFNVLTNRDVEDLKQQLSEMDLEEESKSSVIEKLDKRKWYNSLADVMMAADRFNQLTSGLNAHNLHVALYSSTYISMLGYFNSQGRISNTDEIPIFMIDGVASVAMSKSMLWIYSSGKLFSEYLYNIIAIQITSKLFSNVLIVNLKSGRNVSFSIQNGFPKKAVLAINTLIYELKQGKYATPIYLNDFIIQPFTAPVKEQHNAAVDLDYLVERFVEKDYSGIVSIDFGIAVKCCKQRDWSETERWIAETLGINSALNVIWYVDLSRFLNGREGFAVGTDYLYLQKQNQPLIIIPISEIRKLDINNNCLYISTMENTTYRVDFRSTNDALILLKSSLEEFIDGIRMLQAKGIIDNPQIPVNELNVGIEPQMPQEDGFGSRFNRFVGGFSKKTGTFTISSFEKNVPQQERVESESAYVEPYNDTTVGDPFTQNIQFQSEQNREPIKAGRAFTDNRNSNTYDSNIGLEQQRFCYNCGKPITGDYNFCFYCGAKLKK